MRVETTSYLTTRFKGRKERTQGRGASAPMRRGLHGFICRRSKRWRKSCTVVREGGTVDWKDWLAAYRTGRPAMLSERVAVCRTTTLTHEHCSWVTLRRRVIYRKRARFHRVFASSSSCFALSDFLLNTCTISSPVSLSSCSASFPRFWPTSCSSCNFGRI